MQKKCTECGIIKDVSNFHISKRDGYKSKCKYCISKINRKPKRERKCLECGNVFIQKNSLSKYCSYKCTYTAAHKKVKNANSKKECKLCNKEFKPHKTTDIYCSRKCFSEDSKQSRLDTNNPSYRNGYYTKKHKLTQTNKNESIFNNNRDKIKSNIIETYGCLLCENCNTNDSLRFEMHHIIFRSEKPLHKHIHNTENLILLCIKCHNEFHKNKGIRNEMVKSRQLNRLFGNDVLNK